jgi:hypothetical protein
LIFQVIFRKKLISMDLYGEKTVDEAIILAERGAAATIC